MRKKEKIKNRVSALLLSGVIVSGLIAPAFSFTARAEALPEILESSATVADCVMSYYAMSGSAVANSHWINTLYQSLGSSFGTIGQFCADGLLTYADEVWQPTQELISNIENAEAYQQLGLGSVFSVSGDEVAAGGGVAVATGGTTLAGATGCVASTGILPVLGGVTASYWGGIAIGTLANHLIDKYKRAVYSGVPVTSQGILNNIPLSSGGCVTLNSSYNTDYLFYSRSSSRVIGLCAQGGKYYNIIFLVQLDNDNYNGSTLNCYRLTASSGYTTVYNTTVKNRFGTFGLEGGYLDVPTSKVFPLKVFSSDADRSKYVSDLQNGSIQLDSIYSPDIIGSNGNQIGQKDNDNYTVPDIKPEIDPGTQSGKPLSLEDWLAFANSVSNNNTQTNPIPDNTELFQEILDAVRSIIPNPSPDPDPDPDPDPNPDPETYPVPGPVPDPSPVPDPDYQPETKPQPDFTEKQTENQTDITEGDPWTTPDLLDKFPFCIPKDIYRVFTKLDSKARSAPHIQWRFHPNNMIDYTFDIDFSQWDSIATLLRTLELLAFIVGLAIGTRKLIIGG